jgi:hypothetical protein
LEASAAGASAAVARSCMLTIAAIANATTAIPPKSFFNTGISFDRLARGTLLGTTRPTLKLILDPAA